MKFKETYTCLVQEPLVLFERAKTEVNLNVLSYIPGSVFRGIVAGKLFAKSAEESTIGDIIFNGNAQFGDAHLQIGAQRSVAMPLSIYIPKDCSLEGENYRHYHQESDKEFPKQYRTGYMAPAKSQQEGVTHNLGKVEYTDSLKSARDRNKGTSKDGEMFMYRSIDPGQIFEFEIRAKSATELDAIKAILHDNTFFVGKSKSAEFGGKVELKSTGRTPLEEKALPNANTNHGTLIYAESNLCFLNEFGEYTWRVTGKDLTGEEVDIDWEKSNVRFYQYAPFNGHRKCFDAERLVIRKGSVFVLKDNIDIASDVVQAGVGVHRTEGLGRIMVNPEFLIKQLCFPEVPKDKNSAKRSRSKLTAEELSDPLIAFLNEKHDSRFTQLRIEEKVDEFLKDNRKKLKGKTTKTQWSNVFIAAQTASDAPDLKNKLLDESNGILTSGANNPWEKEQHELFKEIIDSHAHPKEKVALLTQKMIKSFHE